MRASTSIQKRLITQWKPEFSLSREPLQLLHDYPATEIIVIEASRDKNCLQPVSVPLGNRDFICNFENASLAYRTRRERVITDAARISRIVGHDGERV